MLYSFIVPFVLARAAVRALPVSRCADRVDDIISCTSPSSCTHSNPLVRRSEPDYSNYLTGNSPSHVILGSASNDGDTDEGWHTYQNWGTGRGWDTGQGSRSASPFQGSPHDLQISGDNPFVEWNAQGPQSAHEEPYPSSVHQLPPIPPQSHGGSVSHLEPPPQSQSRPHGPSVLESELMSQSKAGAGAQRPPGTSSAGDSTGGVNPWSKKAWDVDTGLPTRRRLPVRKKPESFCLPEHSCNEFISQSDTGAPEPSSSTSSNSILPQIGDHFTLYNSQGPRVPDQAVRVPSQISGITRRRKNPGKVTKSSRRGSNSRRTMAGGSGQRLHTSSKTKEPVVQTQQLGQGSDGAGRAQQ